MTGIFHGANGNDKNTGLKRSITPIETDGYIIYPVPRTVGRTADYTALAVPRADVILVDPREGDWRAMRLPDIDCRAMMHGASVSSNMDVASQFPFSDRSMMFHRQLTLLGCAFALCLAGTPAHARSERGGFFGGFGGFGGRACDASRRAEPGRRAGRRARQRRRGKERSRRAAAMERRRAENTDNRPPPQRKLSPEERKQLRQNIYDVTRDIYHRGG
ncbi:hypothetical protein [Ralstonia pseudosolanacearum]|uniref:Uncharacterized protein n=1 Tax=Ralstonia solanacearum TaxID=305 RepID=A0ABY6N7V9_RALSL|nr:hypothetical protein LH706_09175 [Ralstonia solanacearum]